MNVNKDHSTAGFRVVSGAASVETGRYFGVFVLAEAVISSITFAVDYDGDESIEGVTLPPGYHPMRFTALTLASGTIRCEKETSSLLV